MKRLRYCTQGTVEALRKSIEQRIDWYYDPKREPIQDFIGGFRDSAFVAPELDSKLIFDASNLSKTDTVNALIVYDALKGLTAHQASIERVWVYLCHYDCPDYVSKRWLNSNIEDEADPVTKVVNHFFAKNNRALIRDNGVSRLWWLGKIAHDVDEENPKRFLQLLLYRQDIRSSLLERPFFSRNLRLLKAIYVVMQEHWEDGRELFQRNCFRGYMQALNRRGGVVLLDALSKDDLLSLLRKEAENAIG